MAENLDRVPPNIRRRYERALIEAERTLTAAATQPAEVPPPGRHIFFLPGSRATQLAVPTVLSVVADVVAALSTHARTYVWSATELRVTVEDVITATARHLFDAFPLRHTPFDSFRTEVVHAARKAPWWPAYQAALEERSSASVTPGERLKTLYRETGWSIEQLEEKVGVDRRSLFRHFSGDAQPSRQNLQTYERVFSEALRREIVLAS